TGTLTIGQSPLTATPLDQEVTYGTAVPPDTFKFVGFTGTDTSSVLTGTATFTYRDANNIVVANPVKAGTYSISASGLTSAKYAITYGTGTLTIDKAPLRATPYNQVVHFG